MNLIDGETFYTQHPSQASLAEQFSTFINSPPLPIGVVQDRPTRVAVLIFGNVDSTENRSLLRTFRQRMREIGVEYRLDIYVVEDESRDIEPYFEIQDSQPDYLVMTKMGALQRRFIEQLLPSSRTKVLMYGFASPIRYWMDAPPLIYIGFDQKQAAKTLASFLGRNLSPEEVVSAFILPDGYLGRVRCDLFLDEMKRYGKAVQQVFVIKDDERQAFELARTVLQEQKSGFIFSCSEKLSQGVIKAMEKTAPKTKVQTNAWNLSSNTISDLKTERAAVNVLFMKDALSIAAAEAIKLDLEGKNMPSLYMARFTVVTSDLDLGSLRLLIEDTYPYSVDLWQK
ncbi:hypothetical protein OAH87_01510 [Marinomonas sp.]|nr:hypothetical protein [Marinomonas sp.]MDB4837123.1 hypothetical protein [Marinomonas sp.]